MVLCQLIIFYLTTYCNLAADVIINNIKQQKYRRLFKAKNPENFIGNLFQYMDGPTEDTVTEGAASEPNEPAGTVDESNGTNGVPGESQDQGQYALTTG